MNIETIIDKLGIEQLSEMQKEVADAILHSNKDVMVVSPTGSGKTLAYLLPLIQRLDPQSGVVQAVVIVPGRELALQSSEVLKNIGCGIRSLSLYGGRSAMDEHRELKKVMPQIVFATPGRINDHLDKNNIDAGTVKWLILDEFDKCFEMGFHEEMIRVVNNLPAIERRVLLSATNSESVPHFLNMGRTLTVDYTSDEEQISERVNIYKVLSPINDKLETLNGLLRSLCAGSSIVFLNYRDAVERTADYLTNNGFYVSSFHGGMEQKEREAALYKFSNGSSNIFVSTDLASRGLNIPDIDNIIHYHLPEKEDNYIHRVGRTARWDATGKTFFILGPEENIPEYVKDKPETYNIPAVLPKPALPRMVTIYIGKGKKDKISKGDIVGFLCKKGGLEVSEIGRIDVQERYSYVAISRTKLNKVLKQTAGEKIKGIKTIIEKVR